MNELTACIYNNFHGAGRNAKSLEILLGHDKTSLTVRELCASERAILNTIDSIADAARSPSRYRHALHERDRFADMVTLQIVDFVGIKDRGSRPSQ